MVLAGLTATLPLAGCVPTPLSIATLLALLVVQAKVVESPAVMGVDVAALLRAAGRDSRLSCGSSCPWRSNVTAK